MGNQRIAWTVLQSGKVAMIDIDRGIRGVLVINAHTHHPVIAANDYNDWAVIAAYDYLRFTPANREEQQEFDSVVDRLIDAAKKQS
jgi:hypothetical protein